MSKYSATVTGVTVNGARETYTCHGGQAASKIDAHTHRTPEAAAVCGARTLRALTASAAHRRDAATRFLELGSMVCYQEASGAWVRYAVATGLVSY